MLSILLHVCVNLCVRMHACFEPDGQIHLQFDLCRVLYSCEREREKKTIQLLIFFSILVGWLYLKWWYVLFLSSWMVGFFVEKIHTYLKQSYSRILFAFFFGRYCFVWRYQRASIQSFHVVCSFINFIRPIIVLCIRNGVLDNFWLAAILYFDMGFQWVPIFFNIFFQMRIYLLTMHTFGPFCCCCWFYCKHRDAIFRSLLAHFLVCKQHARDGKKIQNEYDVCIYWNYAHTLTQRTSICHLAFWKCFDSVALRVIIIA